MNPTQDIRRANVYMSNLSPEEHYRLHGTLTPKQIEHLLDLDEQCEITEGNLQEAMASYPDEYFLQDLINDLTTLACRDSVPESVYEELLAIIKRLEDVQSDVANDTEKGLEALDKVYIP